MSGQGSRLLGAWGETVAANWIRKQGGRIVAANWKCRFGEIDLICEEKGYLCFTEVKLRKDSKFAQAREFVEKHKQERLRLTAQHYLCQHPSELQPRFDVAEVYAPMGVSTKDPQINYIENAF